MSKWTEIDIYLNWLYFDILDGPESRFKAYYSLFKALLDIPYVVVHPMDKNRFEDGLELREDYCRENGIDFVDICPECTVLEMFVAFAYRIEKEIMASASGKFDCFRWFWGFIEALELDEFDENDYDKGWICKIIDNFLYRKYDKFGKNGGIFLLHFCNTPAFEMELWDQMNEFLVENYL